MQPSLTITAGEIDGDHQVIKFNGEFDKAGHSDIREALDKLITEFSAKTLIFDFNGLKFINSEGIGYLMEIHTHLVNRDKQLAILGLSSNVEDVFKTIGINEIIPVYKNMDSYLSK